MYSHRCFDNDLKTNAIVYSYVLVSPLHFQSDSNLYATNQGRYKGPFMDLVDYFKDTIINEGE